LIKFFITYSTQVLICVSNWTVVRFTGEEFDFNDVILNIRKSTILGNKMIKQQIAEGQRLSRD